MKRYISFFTLVALCSSLAGCEMEEGCVGDMPPSCRLLNKSEHVVALVNRPGCVEMPDSLILRPGDDFEFDSGLGSYNPSLYFFTNYGYTARLVYYDSRYVIRFEDLPFRQQPTTYTNFWEGMPVHTFTDEDYAYAVEHGTDLSGE